MTYQEIIDYANTLIDDYRNPFMDDVRMSKLLYDSIMEFVKQAYMQGEQSEYRREDLVGLVKTHTFGGGATLELSDIDDFMFAFNLSGTFTDPCNDQATITRAIRPVKLDRINVILLDTFESPDNYYPVYTQKNDSVLGNILTVYSTDAPTASVMAYIALPVNPENADLDYDSPETSEETHLEIGKILARKIMEVTEDFNRYPLAQNEIQLQR